MRLTNVSRSAFKLSGSKKIVIYVTSQLDVWYKMFTLEVLCSRGIAVNVSDVVASSL